MRLARKRVWQRVNSQATYHRGSQWILQLMPPTVLMLSTEGCFQDGGSDCETCRRERSGFTQAAAQLSWTASCQNREAPLLKGAGTVQQWFRGELPALPALKGVWWGGGLSDLFCCADLEI